MLIGLKYQRSQNSVNTRSKFKKHENEYNNQMHLYKCLNNFFTQYIFKWFIILWKHILAGFLFLF